MSMRYLFADSALRYSDVKDLANPPILFARCAGIRVSSIEKWEDGSEETGECPDCERMIGTLNGQSKD
jgi:hypothetical protein